MRRFDIKWTNFRSLDDTGWLEIKPITIIIGANASGKTSLIAPLLLIKQTLESTDTSLALRTQGRYFNAGSFDNLVCHHDVKRTLTFALRFRYPKDKPRSLSPIGVYPPGVLQVSFSRAPTVSDIVLQRYAVLDIHGREMLVRERTSSGSYDIRILSEPQLPSSFVNAVSKVAPSHFMFTAHEFFQTRFAEERDKRKKQKHANDIGITVHKSEQSYLNIIAHVHAFIERIFSELSYIGPLRERPLRMYEISGENPKDVGGRGQDAPEIIFRNRSSELVKHVNEWVRRFEFGFQLECNPIGGGAFELVVRRSDNSPWVNHADTGFGLSQVLPLIVQGCYAKPGSLLIAEQPEIHLNPRLQSVLADLFVEITKRKNGVLVETHSEHLLLRLRRLIAEKKIAAKDVSILYVERDGDLARIRSVPVSTNGHIDSSDWPRGFFDESLREALALATAQGAAND